MRLCHAIVPVQDYDLDATLDSGQVFGFRATPSGWEGSVSSCWMRLCGRDQSIEIEWMGNSTGEAVPAEILDFLGAGVSLGPILSSFPQDAVMRRAVAACRGLRLLKQDPWTCLASFILSSTKQITQIKQIYAALCLRLGDRLRAPPDAEVRHAFPLPEAVVRAGEKVVRECKAGFRAAYLVEAARRVLTGEFWLGELANLPIAEARAELMNLPGVGPKVADCVLLFTGAHAEAFPVDVWIARALRELYFQGKLVSLDQLREFAARHFGPHGGYAQQYLFHYARVHGMPWEAPA